MDDKATSLQEINKECILEALSITRSSYNGQFQEKLFTQIEGATIGGPDLASVTDIFGAVYIDEVARQGDGSLKPSHWSRYRDDKWDIEEVCDYHMVKNFTNYLDETILKDKIKFEPVTKETRSEFLDVKVHLKNGYLISEIYSKETDSHEYLNPNSAHPLSVTKNNPYSVALRVRRNCSDRDVDDNLSVNNLIQYKAYLMHSGHDEEAIDKQVIKVAKMKRKETLESKPWKNRFRPKQRKYNFVTTWDPMFQILVKPLRNLFYYW